MDTDQILNEIHAMRADLTDNHIEVVQRLTKLEMQIGDVDALSARVSDIERYKYRLGGATAVLALASGWLVKKLGL